ncbi:MAG: hypothetical protein INR69_14910 [Mucilaginibacter polytrichastri]|nr:hypothetical protein [Mucilaginibacter polytrichastri]
MNWTAVLHTVSTIGNDKVLALYPEGYVAGQAITVVDFKHGDNFWTTTNFGTAAQKYMDGALFSESLPKHIKNGTVKDRYCIYLFPYGTTSNKWGYSSAWFDPYQSWIRSTFNVSRLIEATYSAGGIGPMNYYAYAGKLHFYDGWVMTSGICGGASGSYGAWNNIWASGKMIAGAHGTADSTVPYNNVNGLKSFYDYQLAQHPGNVSQYYMIFPTGGTHGSVTDSPANWDLMMDWMAVPEASARPTIQLPVDMRRMFSTGTKQLPFRVFDDSAVQLQRVDLSDGVLVATPEIYLDFAASQEVVLQRIDIHGGQGTFNTNKLKIYGETDNGTRTLLLEYGGNYNALTQHAVGNVSLRYLVLVCNRIDDGGWTIPAKIRLYGTVKPEYVAPGVTMPAATPVANMLAVNDYPWNLLQDGQNKANAPVPARLEVEARFKGTRTYVHNNQVEQTEGGYTLNTNAGQGWMMDSFFQAKKDYIIFPLLTLLKQTDYEKATYPSGQQNDEYLPIKYNISRSDPASWRPFGRRAKQCAQRWGSAGQNTVGYTMTGNEMDATWKGTALAYLNFKDYGPFLSMMYDGHNGAYTDAGVKNGDPLHRLVTPALANGRSCMLFFANLWWKRNRGTPLPADIVFAFNHYDNTAGGQSGGAGGGTGNAPENGNLPAIMDRVWYVIQNIIGTNIKVWITETGYDENADSPQRAVATSARNQQLTKADWSVRKIFLASRLGIERVFFYELYDTNWNGSGGLFGNMGLVNGNMTSRPLTFHMLQLRYLIAA